MAVSEPAIPERGPAAFVAEFIGTAALVFFITMVIVLFISPPQAQGQGLPPVQPFIDWSVIGLVHIFALFMLIQVFAVISGAHFNPARSFGASLVGHHWGGLGHWIVVYALGPVVGGVLAAVVYFYLFLAPGKKGAVGMEPVG